MWKIGEEIGDKEGRLDICVTGHGIAPPPTATLDFSAALFQKVSIIFSKLFTATTSLNSHERFWTRIRMVYCTPRKRLVDRWLALGKAEALSCSPASPVL